jgi:hypothetical protein
VKDVTVKAFLAFRRMEKKQIEAEKTADYCYDRLQSGLKSIYFYGINYLCVALANDENYVFMRVFF